MASDKKDLVDPWEKLGVRPTSIGSVGAILDVVWAMPNKFAVCLVGDTGIGKTPVVEQWTAKDNGYLRVFNLGQASQEEISMINFSEDGKSFDFVPPGWLLDLNQEAEARGKAVLFLDEWNRGDKALVNALFTLCDKERRIHQLKLHPNVLVVAAMNPSDGAYLVSAAEKDHAIRKRLNFVYCVQDLAAWFAYTKKNKWHPLIPSFVKAAPEYFYDTGARDAGKTFPCPANWEKVSDIFRGAESSGVGLCSSPVRILVEGQVGTVASAKFLRFVEDENTLIQPAEILHKYTARSKVRRRVAALLGCKLGAEAQFVSITEDGVDRSASLTDLSLGVAMELFSEMPDVDDVADHIARFIGDLPPEVLSTFTAQHLNEQSNARGMEGEQYLTELSSAMVTHPDYKRNARAMAEAAREYRRQAGLITERGALD